MQVRSLGERWVWGGGGVEAAQRWRKALVQVCCAEEAVVQHRIPALAATDP